MWCKKCNRETEEKKCSVCGAVTEEDIPYELYWCDNCKVHISLKYILFVEMICNGLLQFFLS